MKFLCKEYNEYIIIKEYYKKIEISSKSTNIMLQCCSNNFKCKYEKECDAKKFFDEVGWIK